MKEYFSHDYGAVNDRKIAALVDKYKSSGYGIFWATCEMMHEEGGALELDDITYAAIAKNINEDKILLKNVIEDCINKFKLFLLIDEKLTSNRVKKNLHKRLTISDVRAKAGKAGANAKQMKANAEQNQANKRKEIKESKINKTKENKEKENDFVCYDAEKLILKNTVEFERICMTTGKSEKTVKDELRKYHLWMEKKENYPVGKKAAIAGLESWILNLKNFNHGFNGTKGSTQSVGGGLPGSSVIPADKKY